MEDLNKENIQREGGEILNISTPIKKTLHRKKPRNPRKKWIVLVLIFVIATVPAIFILMRSSSDSKTEVSYEGCIKECVLSKNSGESEAPYGNCFEYCKEDPVSP